MRRKWSELFADEAVPMQGYFSPKALNVYEYIQLYMLVSNTSTLVLLAKIGLLEKFAETSPKVAIPTQVRTEYAFERNSYYARLIDRLINEKKIEVKYVDDKALAAVLRNFRLDRGEAAAYLLYKRGKYEAVLTDDGELIKLCKLDGIPFLCALSVVIRLYEKGLISRGEARERISKLNKIGRYSSAIYEHFSRQLEKR
ncbi:MAG: hypothetical protein HY694_04820 [Deltaproteobacteria bacterium]|nr:hypothetical protein [Deltaproteobacteria bacterium]